MSNPQYTFGTTHPVFARNRFEQGINYDSAFARPAILASNLLDTPQAHHFFYGMFFGRNRKTEKSPASLRSLDIFPQFWQEYASNKSISDMMVGNRRAVRRELTSLASRISFRVADMQTALTEPLQRDLRTGGSDSKITIPSEMYDALMKKNQSDNHIALIQFYVAIILIHELAHAAHFSVMGFRRDDFFEDSIIAEGGFELESRLFGLVPLVDVKDPSTAAWCTWQDAGFPLNWHVEQSCRDLGKFNRFTGDIKLLDASFAIELLSDDFWNNAYQAETTPGKAIIPAPTLLICDPAQNSELLQYIPRSVKELLVPSSQSYAASEYNWAVSDGPNTLRRPAR